MSKLRKGEFDINHYKENENVVSMKRWLEPALINNGDVTVSIMGVPVAPGETFQIGAVGIVLEQEIIVPFTGTESGTKKFSVAYCRVEENNC